jgi:pimeloyl-ACP methyl ester carboxylesterase
VQHTDPHPDRIKRIYALDKATASDAMRAYGVGEWYRQTLGYRLDMARAEKDLCDWVVREMDRTPPEIAAAMHDCFEEVDTVPLLPRIVAPVLLLSGDNSPIASAQQQIFAKTLPNGRIEAVAGVGHGANLLQPQRCARLAAEFWRSAWDRGRRCTDAGPSHAPMGMLPPSSSAWR